MVRKKLFAVLDIDHPMVAWEVAIGRVLATHIEDDNKDVYNCPSLWFYNNLMLACRDKFHGDLNSEIVIERYRNKLFPEKPSRFSGAFFFESYNDAISACNYWGWESKIDYISEIDFFPDSYIKADSNIITNKLRSVNIMSEADIENAVKDYFTGGIYEKLEPLYEVICTGYGHVLNNDLRRLAYKSIRHKMPDSSFTLALAISAFEQNPIEFRDLFRVIPWVEQSDNNVIGSFLINLVSFAEKEGDIAKITKRNIHNNGTTLCNTKINDKFTPLKIYRPLNKNTIMSVADFRDLFFTMPESEWNAIVS